jgi:flagellar biosynthesis protein FliP
MKKINIIAIITVLVTVVLGVLAHKASAQDFIIPKFNFIEPAQSPQDVTLSLQIFFLLTVLALAPSLFIMTTCFARVTVVLSFLKQASGIQQTPQQLIMALSLFVTAMIMMPVWEDINKEALQPYLKKEISQAEGINRAITPMREFMLRQTREKDIALFVYFAKIEKPRNAHEVPLYVLIPAFMISEMKTAFIYGFLIYLPFLVVDMVVASVLLSMGMMVLPPMLIATPFKIILFILVDGWYLVLRSLVGSFN